MAANKESILKEVSDMLDRCDVVTVVGVTQDDQDECYYTYVVGLNKVFPDSEQHNQNMAWSLQMGISALQNPTPENEQD